MLHVTHKDCLKLVGVGVITVVLFLGATFSSVVQAKPVDLSLTAEVKKSVSCFSFARAQGKDAEVLTTYLRRIGKASESAGAVYQLGYTEGMLDAYGYANASKFADKAEARLDAAKSLYKLIGCTINESI